MRRVLAVDGYNIIHAWADLRTWMERAGLPAARDRLCDMVHDYAVAAGYHAIVVFDAYHNDRQVASQQQLGGMDIVYTASGETADHFIERLALDLKDTDCELYVATGDALEQSMILGRGAVRLLPRELLEDMSISKRKRDEKSEARGVSIEQRIDPKVRAALEKIRLGEEW